MCDQNIRFWIVEFAPSVTNWFYCETIKTIDFSLDDPYGSPEIVDIIRFTGRSALLLTKSKSLMPSFAFSPFYFLYVLINTIHRNKFGPFLFSSCSKVQPIWRTLDAASSDCVVEFFFLLILLVSITLIVSYTGCQLFWCSQDLFWFFIIFLLLWPFLHSIHTWRFFCIFIWNRLNTIIFLAICFNRAYQWLSWRATLEKIPLIAWWCRLSFVRTS